MRRLTRSRANHALLAAFCAIASGLLSVAAIGNAVAADAPSSKIDPCKLITAAEVQDAVGSAMGQPTASDNGIFRNCVFASSDAKLYLSFEARNLEQSSFERGMKMQPHGLAVVDPSLAADAYTDPSSGTLLVWKGGVTINILFSDHSGNRSKANLEQVQEKLAKKALARM